MSDPQFLVHVDAELQRLTVEIERLQNLKTKLQDLKQELTQGAMKESEAPSAEQADPPPGGAQTSVTEVEHAAVPQARRAEPKSEKGKPAKKAPAKKASRAKKTSKAPRARRARRDGPSRTDLILELLDEQPRSAGEVTKLLEEKHPDQKAPEGIVRTALNSLVGRDRAHLSRQGQAVFYSRPASAASADGSTADDPEAAVPEESAAATV